VTKIVTFTLLWPYPLLYKYTCREKIQVEDTMTDKLKGTASELTPKQLHFARCVAGGMSQAAAYREAYGCKPNSKPETQQANASRLMSDSRVRARVDAIIRQKEAGIAASAVSDRERVLSKLRHLLDNAEPADTAKLRAAELLGKSVGLFRDVVETSTNKTSSDLLSDLENLLDVAEPDSIIAEAAAPDPDPDRTMH
jgi:hypothetical protein